MIQIWTQGVASLLLLCILASWLNYIWLLILLFPFTSTLSSRPVSFLIFYYYFFKSFISFAPSQSPSSHRFPSAHHLFDFTSLCNLLILQSAAWLVILNPLCISLSYLLYQSLSSLTGFQWPLWLYPRLNTLVYLHDGNLLLYLSCHVTLSWICSPAFDPFHTHISLWEMPSFILIAYSNQTNYI